MTAQNHAEKMAEKMNELVAAAEKAAGKLPPLTLKVDRVANTPILGTHGRKRAGMGEAFWQYDEYRPGQHETKQIAWRESAKSDNKTFVRQNEWEASQAAYIWIDNAPEMDFSGDPKNRRTKSEVAQIIGLTLARALCDADERVGLLGEGGSKLSSRIDGMVAALAAREAQDADLHSWQNLGNTGRPPLRNATVVLISDFMEDPEIIKESLARLANRHVRGHLIQVLDPAEVNLPYNGHVEFDDFRGGKLRLPKAQDVRREYYARLQAQQTRLVHIARDAGWGFTCHLTHKPPQDALVPLYTRADAHLPKFEDGATLDTTAATQNTQRRGFLRRLGLG